MQQEDRLLTRDKQTEGVDFGEGHVCEYKIHSDSRSVKECDGKRLANER